MRAIISAKALSEKIGSTLDVAWFPDSNLFARFDDLFEPIEGIKINSYSSKNPILSRIERFKYLKSRSKFVDYFRKIQYDLILNQKELRTNALDEISINEMRNKKVLLKSYAKFYDSPGLTFSCFRPKKYLLEKIEDKSKNFDEYTVGVHVRRNDNAKSISYSTDEFFFKELDSRIEKQKEFNFFLATDCPETESVFFRKYGERMHVLDKDYSTNTLRGIQCAVIDLYLLSGTKEILGSYWSSFSRTSSEIGNSPIKLMGKD